jgi:hypothetical protein
VKVTSDVEDSKQAQLYKLEIGRVEVAMVVEQEFPFLRIVIADLQSKKTTIN